MPCPHAARGGHTACCSRTRHGCKQIIKNSRVPIICIANDGYNQKIKSLKNYCLELKFAKPMHTMVVKRLKMIAEVRFRSSQPKRFLEL